MSICTKLKLIIFDGSTDEKLPSKKTVTYALYLIATGGFSMGNLGIEQVAKELY